jgi:uncharacterized SAM-binding protein YcdF (DUF218 family)
VFYTLSKTLSWVGNPAAWAFLLVLLAVAAGRRPRLAAALSGLAAAQLLAFSSPRVAETLQRWVEASAPRTYRADARYDAAIVLGGSPERVEGGVVAVRSGDVRHLVYSGAMPAAAAEGLVAELAAMGIPRDRIVIERRARNTYENAVESAGLAAERGWRRLLVVTDALHAPRALDCFRRVGLEPDVLPVNDGAEQVRRAGWLPSRHALDDSRAVLHEVIGRVVYRLVGYGA